MEAAEKSDRLIEAASAVLKAAPRCRLNAVVLHKALFYLDLASLRDRGDTITHNTYIGIQQGPVVAKYQTRLIGQLEGRGVAKQLSEWDGSKPIVLECPPERFLFLDDDAMGLASAVTSHFAQLTSGEASAFSHENPGWRMAWEAYLRTKKPSAVNLHIALQQIVEDDPWMDRPLMDDDELFAAADAGDGADW
ncbi:hypothetical protein Pla175_01380 [Pirellulimonas nuda]|uniref:Antitoxin SocA-like Panacea domain-containing protein n=1 Tax=Pirellulimonas nuda TaxID=2528009 RepID=A0A518D5N7_9BACT|nr:type II toxin-antitoxin system antitoxin SocA domain-containing protein [Pirellulimonas nuda]QDU86786.1 hypothetical protein Pla175_01380 [Pirellulimonas nuda]